MTAVGFAKQWKLMRTTFIVLGGLIVTGCSREPDPEWSYSDEVQEWSKSEDEDLQAQYELTIDSIREHSGTWSNPKMLGDPDFDPDQLLKGRDVYSFYCQQCHGVTGDGRGPAADILRPRPRDYRLGKFKFTSTPYGNKPRRADLMETVRRGVSGTSMPSFSLLGDDELEAVIDYVLVLTHRGELENSLKLEADIAVDEEEYVQEEIVDFIVKKWEDAEGATVYPLTPQPRFTAENVQRGYEVFLEVGCIKCHGVDGRGATEGEIRKDDWGFVTKAADITSGMLHGGAEPIDIYRRIHSGINGTPMPNFSGALKQNPEKLWDLTAYVMYLANVRREGKSVTPIEFPKPGESVLEATMELSQSQTEIEDEANKEESTD